MAPWSVFPLGEFTSDKTNLLKMRREMGNRRKISKCGIQNCRRESSALVGSANFWVILVLLRRKVCCVCAPEGSFLPLLLHITWGWRQVELLVDEATLLMQFLLHVIAGDITAVNDDVNQQRELRPNHNIWLHCDWRLGWISDCLMRNCPDLSGPAPPHRES